MFSYDNQSISISVLSIWLSISISISIGISGLTWRLSSPNLLLPVGETQLLWSRRGSHGEWATKKVLKNHKKNISVFKIALLLWVT